MANKQLLHDVIVEIANGNSDKAADILAAFLSEKTKEMSSKKERKCKECECEPCECEPCECETTIDKGEKVEEKWSNPAFIPEKEKGKHSGKTIEELKSAREKLKAKKERTAAETSELKSINFAIRARTGWKSID